MVEFLKNPRNIEPEDLAKIKEHLSREGVIEVLKRVDQKFKRQPGRILFYGVTSDGLVVGVREGYNRDFAPDYFKTMVVDTKLPADQIEQQIVEASFPYDFVDKYRDGGTTIFPAEEMLPDFAVSSKMTDQQLKAKYPDNERMLPLVAFYKQTGGFHFPTPLEPGRPRVGERTVYPLNLS